MPVRALEFYSGIGGLHLAFLRSEVDGFIVQAFDWDQTACQVYGANHPSNIVKKMDIASLTAKMLASFNADLWLLSPACQPYTVLNPKAKGETDSRAKSFIHLIQNVLPELAQRGVHPSHILIENVAGFETSSTRQISLSTLRSLGYTTLELLITPLQYGIPNSRLRYYLLGKLLPLKFSGVSTVHTDEVWRHIPGHRSWVDPRSGQESANSDIIEASGSNASVHQIGIYLDQEDSEDTPHPYIVPDKILQKWGRLFDIVLPSSRRTCCFTRGYTQLVERAGSIIQMNENLNTSETFNRYLQASGNAQSIEILRPLRLRYFSPAELLRLFHFSPPWSKVEFTWPENITTKTKYRLIGNSVNVKVVEELINYLFKE